MKEEVQRLQTMTRGLQDTSRKLQETNKALQEDKQALHTQVLEMSKQVTEVQQQHTQLKEQHRTETQKEDTRKEVMRADKAAEDTRSEFEVIKRTLAEQRHEMDRRAEVTNAVVKELSNQLREAAPAWSSVRADTAAMKEVLSQQADGRDEHAEEVRSKLRKEVQRLHTEIAELKATLDSGLQSLASQAQNLSHGADAHLATEVLQAISQLQRDVQATQPQAGRDDVSHVREAIADVKQTLSVQLQQLRQELILAHNQPASVGNGNGTTNGSAGNKGNDIRDGVDYSGPHTASYHNHTANLAEYQQPLYSQAGQASATTVRQATPTMLGDRVPPAFTPTPKRPLGRNSEEHAACMRALDLLRSRQGRPPTPVYVEAAPHFAPPRDHLDHPHLSRDTMAALEEMKEKAARQQDSIKNLAQGFHDMSMSLHPSRRPLHR